MPKQPPQGRGSGGRVTPSSRSTAGSSPSTGAKGAGNASGKGAGKSAGKGSGAGDAPGAAKGGTSRARVPRSTKPAPRSKTSKAAEARAAAAEKTAPAKPGGAKTGGAKTGSAKSGGAKTGGARSAPSKATGAKSGTAKAGTAKSGSKAVAVEEDRPKGLKGFLTGPPDPNYIPPKDRERPWWGMGDMALWFFVSNVLGGIFIAIGATLGGYSLTWPSGTGAAVGEAVGRAAAGQAPSVTKTVADVPYLQYAVVSLIPLWIAFLGGPWLVVKRKGTSLKEDFGFTMQWKDVPLGLAIGIVSQVVLITVLYRVIFVFTGEQDVSAEAERLVDRASSPLMYLLLFLLTAFGSPVFEELFFRGLSQRAIAKRLGPIWGLVLAAVFFALVHGQYLQFPGLLLFGLILGYLAMRFNRLGPSIWAHIGFNMVTAVILIWNQIVR